MARRARSDDEEQDELDRAEASIRERQRKEKGQSSKKKSSKGKGRASNGNDDAESEQDDDSSDAAGATQGKSKGKITEAELTEQARLLVRYAICNEASKRTLRRDEITKKAIPGYTRHFNKILEEANEMLEAVFGMELVAMFDNELETSAVNGGDKKQKKKKRKNGEEQEDGEGSSSEEAEAATATADAKKTRKKVAKLFCLRSNLPEQLIRASIKSHDDPNPEFQARLNEDLRGALGETFAGIDSDGNPLPARNRRDADTEELKDWKRGDDAIFDWRTGPEQRTLYGILYVILSLILVNERVLTDEQLMNHLKKLGLRYETVLPLHPGALRADKFTLNVFLGTLIRQHYLEKILVGPKSKGAGTQGGTQATQKVKATQSTQRKLIEGAPTSGSSDEEWRWGARAVKEIGEDGIASFIKDFFRSQHASAAQVAREGDEEAVRKPSDQLMAEIVRGATGGKANGRLVGARDDE